MPQIDPKQIKQAGATTSQVLTFDGTKWAPADAAGGGGAVDPSVIPSNQEWPSAKDVDNAGAFSLDGEEALYIPFHVNAAATIKRIALFVNTAVASIDVGIYQLDGTRLVSSGSTLLLVGAQIINIADTALTAGRFYMAVSFDVLPTQLWRWTLKDEAGVSEPPGQILLGLKKETTAFPLPASATFADPTISDVGLPVLSLLLEA